MLLRAEAVSKSFGPHDIIKSADVSIEAGDRIGLVGANGVGKTTFIRILMGSLRQDMGEVIRSTDRIGYLPQLPAIEPQRLVREVIGTPYGDLSKVAARLGELEAIMATGGEDPGMDWGKVAAEYSRLQEEMARGTPGSQVRAGETRSPSGTPSRASSGTLSRASSMASSLPLHVAPSLAAVLEEVGLPETIPDRRFSDLSGGERTKVMLARVLMQSRDADIIFLDEPTSHLDIETTEWLEDYLLTMKGALVVISHDRYFLDRTVTRVWDLDAGALTEYRGTYSEFVVRKAAGLELLRKASRKHRIEVDRQLRIAEEQYRRNPYLTTHKTRLKMVERLADVDAPPEGRDLAITFEAAEKSGKDVLLIKGMRVWKAGPGDANGGSRGKVGIGNGVTIRGSPGPPDREGDTPRGRGKGPGHPSRREAPLIEGVDLSLEKGDRLGIFGPNGSGKTTFLRALLGELPSEGDVWVAPGARIGYFAQGHDALDPNLTAEEQMLLMVGKENRLMARTILARFLITGEDAERPIATLSGGERARVALATLLAGKKNLLILDEPTNYLDIRSQTAVESALREYPGTLVMVSHDRYLLDAVCTRVGDLRDGKLRVFNGNYSAMKGQKRTEEVLTDAPAYRVVTGFTDWVTRTKYRAGDRIAIADRELNLYQWAFDTGKLKRIPGKKERKHVKKG